MPSAVPVLLRPVVEGFDRDLKSLGLFAPGPAGFNPYTKADDTTSVQTPTTGFTITVATGTRALILTPAGTLATGTIDFPVSTGLVDGQELVIGSTQIQTALTLSGNGATISGAVTAFASANLWARYKYVASTTTWYRVG